MISVIPQSISATSQVFTSTLTERLFDILPRLNGVGFLCASVDC